MNTYGIASVSDFLGDYVVYRNLIPFDSRLANLQSGVLERIPRKLERAYAVEMSSLLKSARSLDLKNTPLQQIVYLGDTRLSDGTAFRNLCDVGGWQGIAFIADEILDEPERFEVEEAGKSTICVANRWHALEQFKAEIRSRSFVVDEHTVVIIDLDKTAFGARGRNDHVIDQARKQAVQETVAKLIGSAFNETNFEQAYDYLNQPLFHPLTEDNQDYLAYICLIIESGLWDLPQVTDEFNQGRFSTFHDFLEKVKHQFKALHPSLTEIHNSVQYAVQNGDPTPFKDFRRMEYLVTVDKMNPSDEANSADIALRNDIVMTAEVLESARGWANNGALLFGLSDKPDEASIPLQEQIDLGYLPIHQIKMHVVGV